MKPVKKSKPKAEPMVPRIDADVLARINHKIENAHHQIDALGKSPKRVAEPKPAVEPDPEVEQA